MALSPYDQSIYDAGFKYVPQSQYLLNPFQIPQGEESEGNVAPGLPAIYQAQGGGGGTMPYTGSTSSLMSGFQTSVDSRQDRLRSLNMPLEQKGIPGGDILMENIGVPGIESMPYDEAQFGPVTIKGAPGVYQAGAKNTLSRRIQDAVYGILPGGKPQTAEMILNEGYNNPYGVGGPGILGAILGKMDNYSNLSRADQAFIAANMGYTGPTVFGENTSGLSKDPFGINVRSAFGNYGEYVDKTASSLEDALDRARNKYDTEEEFLDMTKMMRNKLNFYRQKQKEYADTIAEAARIQAEKDKDIVNKINVTSDDVASTTTQGGGGGIADPGYGPGGGLDASRMGGGSQQAKSGGQKAGGTGRTDGGWGWADGGIVDLVDIYD